MKRLGKSTVMRSMSPLNSPKRPRRDDDDDDDNDSDDSKEAEEPLEGSSSNATKTPQELTAITWKLCEPAPVKINGSYGSTAVNGDTVYVNSSGSSTLYEFNAVKGEWVSSIECDRKSFGLAVINGDLTLVGGKSLDGSNLKTLTSLVKSGRSGMKWTQKYPPMAMPNTCEGRVPVCGNGEYLVVANGNLAVSRQRSGIM